MLLRGERRERTNDDADRFTQRWKPMETYFEKFSLSYTKNFTRLTTSLNTRTWARQSPDLF
jgi:hypothetical protein